MLRTLSSISALLAAVAIMTLGYGLLGTLLSVRMSVEGFSAVSTGIVMSGYFVGLMVGSLTVARLVEMFGHIRTFAAAASVFSAATLIHALAVESVTWWILRFFEGYCMAALFMCIESWLNDRATNETRGMMLSFYMITTYMFGGLAQFLLTAAAVDGFVLFAITSALMSLCLVPVALTRTQAPVPPPRSLFSLKKLLAISPLGVAGAATAGMAMGAFYGLAPRFGIIVGLDTLGVAVLVGFGIFGGLVLQWPLGRMSDRLDRRKMIAAVSILMAVSGIGVALLTLGGETAPVAASVTAAGANIVVALPVNGWFLLAVVAFGGMMFSIYPLSVSHANDMIDPGDFVAASGGLILFYSLGAVIGPIAAALLMEWVGAHGLFLFMALAGVLLAMFSLYRLRVGQQVPDDQKTPFQAMPRTAYAISDIDPRAEEDQFSFNFDAAPPQAEVVDDAEGSSTGKAVSDL